MIPTSSYIGIAFMIGFGLLVPIGVAIWWIRTCKEKVTTVLIGAATWFVFAVILESIPKAIFFNPMLPIGKTVMGNAALFTLLSTFFAGIFEETGRFVAFKTLLRKRKNKETAISYGIGHGCFEAMFILLIAGVQYLVYAAMINSGRFQEMIDQLVTKGIDVSGLQALPRQIMAITPGSSCVSMLERICAMLLHLGLSILVFYAVKKSKARFYVLAIFLHALFNVPAAFYQLGVITNVHVVEAMLTVYSIIFFIIVYRAFYKKDTVREAGVG